MLYLHNKLKDCFSEDKDLFEQIMTLQGERFREQKGRLTQRILLNGQYYFIKQHTGVGWKEIFKNLLQGRLPVLGASNEWRALQQLNSLGIITPFLVGYGQRGINPAQRRSFVLMKEISNSISLEDLGKSWQKIKPIFSFKRKLIAEVARIARVMHENNINHRDFYICHFLLDLAGNLNLIDLHRAQIRKSLPNRWRIKDLAGLYFSSKEIGLSQRDIWYFIRLYSGKSVRDFSKQENSFWNKVKQRGEQLYWNHRN